MHTRTLQTFSSVHGQRNSDKPSFFKNCLGARTEAQKEDVLGNPDLWKPRTLLEPTDLHTCDTVTDLVITLSVNHSDVCCC